jgi:hypothetical protein
VLGFVVGRILRLLGFGVRVLRLLAVWVLELVLVNIVPVVILVPSALCASLLTHGHRFAEAEVGTLLLLAAQEHEVASLWWLLMHDHDRRREGKLTSQSSGNLVQSMHSSSTKLQVGAVVGSVGGAYTEYGFS